MAITASRVPRGGLIVLALTGMLMSQSAVGNRHSLPRPEVRPATVAILNPGHPPLRDFFSGLRSDPRLSFKEMLARRHPATKCAPSSGRGSATSWLDRALGVTTVHAQQGNCTGAYFQYFEQDCSTGAPCSGGYVDSSESGGSAYYNGFYCCVYCYGCNGCCGTGYPLCYNGGSRPTLEERTK